MDEFNLEKIRVSFGWFSLIVVPKDSRQCSDMRAILKLSKVGV